MAKTRRVVRKIQTPPGSKLDEQLWPVIVAMFVLCGLMMGVAAAYLPFGGPSWWQDARLWLFAIPIATCLAIWLLRYVDRRLVRRTVQVSIILCLIVHVLLLVASRESYVFGRLFSETSRTRNTVPQRRLVVAEYQEFQLEAESRERQDFVKPVPTPLPEPELQQDREAIQPQPQPQDRPTAEPRSLPVPPQVQTEHRNIADRKGSQASVPKQSEQLSKLSRQSATAQPNAPTQAALPAPRSAPSAAPSLEANAADIARQTPRSATAPSGSPATAPPTVAPATTATS